MAALGKWQDLDFPRKDVAVVPSLPFVTTWHEDEPYQVWLTISKPASDYAIAVLPCSWSQ